MKKILIVGSINQDVTLAMKHLPKPGETIIAKGLKTSLGGKGANQAVAAARMGADVSFIGAIGKDKGSDEILEVLAKDSINIEGIARLEENTGTAYISIDEEAENNIIVYPGANFAFSRDHLYDNLQLFKSCDYCLLQLEVPLEIIKETIKICKEYGLKIILNPAPFHEGLDDSILKDIDFYIPNELEFLSSIQEDSSKTFDLEFIEKKALAFASSYNLTLVVTLGKRGSLLVENNKAKLIAAQTVDAVDTTAAGDSFIGGFLAAFSRGETLEKALNFGTHVAAITISRYGAISAIPYKDEIK